MLMVKLAVVRVRGAVAEYQLPIGVVGRVLVVGGAHLRAALGHPYFKPLVNIDAYHSWLIGREQKAGIDQLPVMWVLELNGIRFEVLNIRLIPTQDSVVNI